MLCLHISRPRYRDNRCTIYVAQLALRNNMEPHGRPATIIHVFVTMHNTDMDGQA